MCFKAQPPRHQKTNMMTLAAGQMLSNHEDGLKEKFGGEMVVGQNGSPVLHRLKRLQKDGNQPQQGTLGFDPQPNATRKPFLGFA